MELPAHTAESSREQTGDHKPFGNITGNPQAREAPPGPLAHDSDILKDLDRQTVNSSESP
jgi:hypothetical protein